MSLSAFELLLKAREKDAENDSLESSESEDDCLRKDIVRF